VVASIVFLSIWGLNLGIDFTGGTLMQVSFNDERPITEEVQSSLEILRLWRNNCSTSRRIRNEI